MTTMTVTTLTQNLKDSALRITVGWVANCCADCMGFLFYKSNSTQSTITTKLHRIYTGLRPITILYVSAGRMAHQYIVSRGLLVQNNGKIRRKTSSHMHAFAASAKHCYRPSVTSITEISVARLLCCAFSQFHYNRQHALRIEHYYYDAE